MPNGKEQKTADIALIATTVDKPAALGDESKKPVQSPSRSQEELKTGRQASRVAEVVETNF